MTSALVIVTLIASQAGSYDPMANARASGDKDRLAAASLLARGAKGVAPLLRMANSTNPNRRGQAVWALAFRKEPRAIRAVVLALFDSSPLVQEKAAWSIRRARDPAYRLLYSFAVGGNAGQRRRSGEVILNHSVRSNPSVCLLLKEMLRKMSSSHFADVREMAARYLNVGQFGQHAVTIRLLTDHSLNVRKAAVSAIYMSGYRVDPIFAALASLTKDKEPTIRAYAVGTLARYPNLRGWSSKCWEIMQITSNALLDPSETVRYYAVGSLATNTSSVGEQAAKALLKQYPQRAVSIARVSQYLRSDELKRRVTALLGDRRGGESARKVLDELEKLSK